MPGHNHYADCMCGWCVKARFKRQITRPYFVQTRFDTYESFTNPNAVCPECGAPVFFYQSPYGGKVYFDELGPPWPKHPCTDHSTVGNNSKSATIVKPTKSEHTSASWKIGNWQPIRVIRIYQEGDWWVVKAETLEGKVFVRLLLEVKPNLTAGMIAHFSGWDENGYSIISYLGEAEIVEVMEISAYKYSDYVFENPERSFWRRAKLKENQLK